MTGVEIQHEEEDLHETEQDFYLVDLDENDHNEDISIVIKEKYALIRELHTNLEMSKYIISYYEQENQQLQAKHDVMVIQLIKGKREEMKAKALLDEAYDKYGEPKQEQEPKIRPRTRGLKRGLELERQKEVELANQLTWNEQFSIMINENREHQLDKVNQNLEKILDNCNQ